MPPFSDIAVVTSHEENTHLQVKRLCIRLLPGWGSLREDDTEITPLSGGISNFLVKVSPTGVHAANIPPVVVKVFGNKTELLIDREKELELLLRLNSCGFGAEVLGIFTNGRIEEFLTAKTLTPDEMAQPLYVPHIARTLRKLHAVPTVGDPTLWKTIDGWFHMVSELSFEDELKAEQFSKIDINAMKQEFDATKAVCDMVKSPVIFSHNDLLSGNILVVQQTEGQTEGGEVDAEVAALGGTITFIDYEYSDCGYRGFDLGNHFNEYAGFECDFSRYPSRDAQHFFLKHYLAGSSSSHTPEAAPREDLDKLEAEANVFALASHIYWGVWALIQARYSPIDFDYLHFSAGRWQEYYRRKEEFVSQAKRVFADTSS